MIINNIYSRTPAQELQAGLPVLVGDFLNRRSYNQMFVEFIGKQADELVITDEDIEKVNKNYGGKSQILNEKGEIRVQPNDGNPEYGVIDEVMRNDARFSGWTGKTIIVIANRNKERDRSFFRMDGFASTNKETGVGNEIILYYSGSLNYATYTHELGHVFGLLHPFSDRDDEKKTKPLIRQGTSRNFMDYSPVTDMFWKWQWDIVRKKIGIPPNSPNKQ